MFPITIQNMPHSNRELLMLFKNSLLPSFRYCVFILHCFLRLYPGMCKINIKLFIDYYFIRMDVIVE